ncbi:MAG: hypothetical protein DMF78_07130 [Acidobacteria bacterium]|nr:MAG: hypothetical protein DMF78_07130 [Acidobacteriota bacterium]
MSKRIGIPVALALVAATTAVPARTQPAPTSAALQSYQRARQMLDRAIEAAGGSAAVLSLKDVSRKGAAIACNQGQSLRPMEKLLFVADLFTIPAEGPIAPAGAATRQFAEKIQALGLQVEKIAPAHGRMGTMDELKQVVMH